jgi:hypothetical protein
LRCDPEILESPANNSEKLPEDNTIYPPYDGVEESNQPGWVPFGAPASSTPPTTQATDVLSSRRIESWQGQYSSTEKAPQDNPQQGYRSQSSVEQLGYGHDDNLRRSNEQTSQYRLQDQRWPPHPHPHHSAYFNSLPSASNADLRSFQLQANENTEMTEGSSAAGSGNGGTRHVGSEQSQTNWLSANDMTFQGSSSGASYFHPTPPSPLSYHANVYGSLDESSSSASHMTSLANRGQSTGHNHALPGSHAYNHTGA